MLRLRFLRILLPLLLIFLGVLVWRSWEPRSVVHRGTTEVADSGGPRVEGLSIKEFAAGTDSNFEGSAEVFEPREDGDLHLEGIRDLEIQREGRGPLLVSAARGERTGGEDDRRWMFEGEVVFREPDAGLRLVLPSLEIDDAAGEARSRGLIRFFAPDLEGHADAIVYGLRGQPGEMERPEFVETGGGSISAERARLRDGVRDVEMIGAVRVRRPDQQVDAGRLRVLRGPQGRLRQAIATEHVSGLWAGSGQSEGQLRADRVELRWDGEGELDSLSLAGDAFVRREAESLAAAAIEVVRGAPGAGLWSLDASQDVYFRGRFGGGPGLLRAEALQASLAADGAIRNAEANGRVRFEGQGMQAEAQRGTYVATTRAPGTVELYGNDTRKARLAQGRTRVAGRTIRTDLLGQELAAEGLVEATLLPAEPNEGRPTRTRLFLTEQAIHFVAERLDSEQAGDRLVFSGSVRGWQGERNLAAEEVMLDQRSHALQARDAVSTRIPREAAQAATAEEDYIQIGADRLDYDDVRGLAVYSGEVRVRMVEGWLEAQRVEVELALDSRQVHEIRASEAVRVEFHRSSEGEMARPVTGTADRLLYDPSEASLRLFGDQVPASVRRIGDGGGTTTGRELHYRLDTGTLSVKSGEQGPGRIKS